MKVPKTLRVYCPKCKTHTEHTIKIYKKGKSRALSWGQRQHEKLLKGYGGSPRGKQRTVKTTKKQVLMLTCKDCGYTMVRKGVRLKKIEVEK